MLPFLSTPQDKYKHKYIIIIEYMLPFLSTPQDGLLLITEAIEKAGYTGKIKIGMDCAASEVSDVIVEGVVTS